MFVDLPHFFPAPKFPSLTGMVDVRCMTAVLISACVYDDVSRGGGWGEPESISDTKGLSCLTSGECCVVLIELSIDLFVNALSLKPPALLVASLVVRWLLYNVHSLILNMCDCYRCPFVLK